MEAGFRWSSSCAIIVSNGQEAWHGCNRKGCGIDTMSFCDSSELTPMPSRAWSGEAEAGKLSYELSDKADENGKD